MEKIDKLIKVLKAESQEEVFSPVWGGSSKGRELEIQKNRYSTRLAASSRRHVLNRAEASL